MLGSGSALMLLMQFANATQIGNASALVDTLNGLSGHFMFTWLSTGSAIAVRWISLRAFFRHSSVLDQLSPETERSSWKPCTYHDALWSMYWPVALQLLLLR